MGHRWDPAEDVFYLEIKVARFYQGKQKGNEIVIDSTNLDELKNVTLTKRNILGVAHYFYNPPG